MKLELNLPEFKRPGSPLTNFEGIKALAIVLGIIVLISGIVYAVKLVSKQRPAVLPAATEAEKTVAPEATEAGTGPQATAPGIQTTVPSEIPTEIPPETEMPLESLPEIPTATASPTVDMPIGPPEANFLP